MIISQRWFGLAGLIMGSAVSLSTVTVADRVSIVPRHSLPRPDGGQVDLKKPVQVFILMGQSNMFGMGDVSPVEKKGTLEFLTKKEKRYPHLLDDTGAWTTRNDVRYVQIMQNRGKMQMVHDEWLTVKGKTLGPEVQFGHVMGHVLAEPILILKSCIGNRSLGWDLLPPGSKRYTVGGKTYAGYKDTPDSWVEGQPKKPSKLLLEDVCGADGLVGLKQPVEFRARVGIEILLVAEDQIALAFDELSVLLARLAALGSAHFIDGLIDVHHQVEPVIDDVRVGKPGLHRGLIGSGTVDADGLNARPLFFAELLEERFNAFLFPALLHVEQFAGFSVEDHGDVALPLANGLFVDEQLAESVKTLRRGVRLEDDLVIAPHRGVTDLEHGGDFGIGCHRGPGADEPHEPPGSVAIGMNLPRTARYISVTCPAKPLHGRKSQINNRTVRHRAVHHRPAAGLVARKPLLAVRAPRAGALVEIEVDLSADFLEVDSRNDIPLEGHQSLDISDFHTRSRQSQQGDVTSKMTGNRHALTTKSRKMAGLPLAQRLRDKTHEWEDLAKLIPDLMSQSVMGYTYTCPDMIGGGEYQSFLGTAKIDEELVVRSAQVHALMPMMQFSVAPWRILSKENADICLKMAKLHVEMGPKILTLANEASKTGEPIAKPMALAFPDGGYEMIKDQFVLGNDIIVAPVVEKGARSRTVVLPVGQWKSEDGIVHTGGSSVKIDVLLERLPYFTRVQ